MAAFPGQTALDTVHTRSKQKGEKRFFFKVFFSFSVCLSLSFQNVWVSWHLPSVYLLTPIFHSSLQLLHMANSVADIWRGTVEQSTSATSTGGNHIQVCRKMRKQRKTLFFHLTPLNYPKINIFSRKTQTHRDNPLSDKIKTTKFLSHCFIRVYFEK